MGLGMSVCVSHNVSDCKGATRGLMSGRQSVSQ